MPDVKDANLWQVRCKVRLPVRMCEDVYLTRSLSLEESVTSSSVSCAKQLIMNSRTTPSKSSLPSNEILSKE